MRVNKKIIYVIFCLITFALIALTTLLLIKKNTFSVINKSSTYSITFNTNAFFNKTVASWGVWKKNAVTINASQQNQTIRNIVVILVDKPLNSEGVYSIYNFVNKSTLDTSAHGTIDKLGNLKITIYLNPESAKNESSEYLSNTFLYMLITQLYNSTHFSQIGHGNESKIVEELHKFMKEKTSPIKIGIL